MVAPRKRQRQRIVMVDDELWDAVNEIAKAQGVSRSELVRRGFGDVLRGKMKTIRCHRGHETVHALWNCQGCKDLILKAVRLGDFDEAKRLSDELEKT